MGTGSVLLKSLAMAAAAGFILSACDDDGRKGNTGRSTNRSSVDLIDTLEAASQGTGFGGMGTGSGGAGTPDHTGVSEKDFVKDFVKDSDSEKDTEFERSFYGPPASDWRFTPGTGLYNFQDKEVGGTGRDSQTKANPIKPP